mgnify:FL=1
MYKCSLPEPLPKFNNLPSDRYACHASVALRCVVRHSVSSPRLHLRARKFPLLSIILSLLSSPFLSSLLLRHCKVQDQKMPCENRPLPANSFQCLDSMEGNKLEISQRSKSKLESAVDCLCLVIVKFMRVRSKQLFPRLAKST